MKAFLQHDESGLFYKEGEWVQNLSDARAFSTVEEAIRFRDARQVSPAHPVRRFDPVLMERFLTHAPGQYQAGE